MESYQVNYLNAVYKDIGKELGLETALRIYNMFKGTQVTFPTRLLSTEFLRSVIKEEYSGGNAKQLALKYGYSERSIKRIIKER